MPYGLEWHDLIRILVFCLSVYCVCVLFSKFRVHSPRWNVKTRDLWYASLMWSFAGVVISAQGIFLDRPFTPALVFVTTATLVSGKGLHRKGSWGGTS